MKLPAASRGDAIAEFIVTSSKMEKMQTAEIEKSMTHILIEIIEYIPNSVVSRTIIRKSTGNISVVAIDTGETLAEKISPFDTYIQVIDGVAEVVIDGMTNVLHTGQAIIIPAHSSHMVKANERFKMISTVIKSGYEGNNI
ncbi:cupin domain-containing protein [Bacteroidota bacterium]